MARTMTRIGRMYFLMGSSLPIRTLDLALGFYRGPAEIVANDSRGHRRVQRLGGSPPGNRHRIREKPLHLVGEAPALAPDRDDRVGERRMGMHVATRELAADDRHSEPAEHRPE